jgi:DNA mismatch repair protein MutS2
MRSPKPWRQEGPARRVLDLHGRTRAEAERLVRDALSAAVRDGVRRLTVIHGKGTGALREVVWAYLDGHPSVAELRLARMSDGGDGATEAYLG